jgi:hypothetical protein
MEKKQTAVEWLYNTIDTHLVDFLDGDISLNDLSVKMLEAKLEALAMEKQHLFEFAKGFWYWGSGPDGGYVYDEDIEKYYKKKYEK